MISKRFFLAKPLLNPISYHHHLRLFTSDATQVPNVHHHHPSPSSPAPSPVNQDHLRRVCTIFYQQQTSPDLRLYTKLSTLGFNLNHEFFLQVCNEFPVSWRPIHRFYRYTQEPAHSPHFAHSVTSFNKMLDIYGKARNIDLFWDTAREMAKQGLVNSRTYVITLKTLASVRELKKCLEFFHMTNEDSVERLNMVMECLCKGKGKDNLVEEAKFVALRLKDRIRPNEVTYGWLVKGFCEVGDLIEASKVCNQMIDEGLDPGVDVFEKMMKTFFKKNEYSEAMKLFQMLRVKRIDDVGLSTYKLVIDWMCKRGMVGQAKMMLEEMRMRGIEPDNSTLGSLVYGLLSRGRISEGCSIVQAMEKPDIGVYHLLIKGFLRLKRAREATEVFREMIRRGCEPTMHTYIMLLQGHLGRRGRKGHDPVVNFDTIFVGGLVKAGKSLEATKYVERIINGGLEVPRFDYNKFLHYFSSEEGVVMFEGVATKLREAGLVDLADILERYGEKMATRDRRRSRNIN